MLNQKYWDQYYKEHPTAHPSSFAIFSCDVFGEYIKDKTVVDFCCGNGRDTYRLAQLAESTWGVDACCCPDSDGDTRFLHGSISHAMKVLPAPEVVYCRFGFHAMEEETVNSILEWTPSYLFAEMRSDKGLPPDNTHDRRLINSIELMNSLSFFGFHIIYFAEGNKLAIKGNEDPVVIRIVAKKKAYVPINEQTR